MKDKILKDEIVKILNMAYFDETEPQEFHATHAMVADQIIDVFLNYQIPAVTEGIIKAIQTLKVG